MLLFITSTDVVRYRPLLWFRLSEAAPPPSVAVPGAEVSAFAMTSSAWRFHWLADVNR